MLYLPFFLPSDNSVVKLSHRFYFEKRLFAIPGGLL